VTALRASAARLARPRQFAAATRRSNSRDLPHPTLALAERPHAGWTAKKLKNSTFSGQLAAVGFPAGQGGIAFA
jgi:hypothetical protein